MNWTLPENPTPDERLTPEKVAEILLTAAELGEREGLHTGDWWEWGPDLPFHWAPGRRVDAVGALAVAAGYRTDGEIFAKMNPYRATTESYDLHPALAALTAWLGVDDLQAVTAWSDAAHEDGEPERVWETFRAIAAGLLAEAAGEGAS